MSHQKCIDALDRRADELYQPRPARRESDVADAELMRWAGVQIRHLRGDYRDLNEEAIVLARAMLKAELGIECAFFDDCISVAIGMAKGDIKIEESGDCG